MAQQWHMVNAINCPFVAALNIVGGKWKRIILHILSGRTMRFGEIKRNIPSVSQKMLTQHLRELEGDGIVHRQTYEEKPLRTEYSLTPKGLSLRPHRWLLRPGSSVMQSQSIMMQIGGLTAILGVLAVYRREVFWPLRCYHCCTISFDDRPSN